MIIDNNIYFKVFTDRIDKNFAYQFQKIGWKLAENL